ncbi:methyltransferase domain-containing protein [Marinicella sp. S1101]|uniref:class I SAM-dependent methyltransferase n=1 Tax=Marinicella marina TaxID=2996016 RepID=UPI002261031B|nr:methyltransferase domain-containing protein [Marinicella marina]MCX7552939.1 methyltransferase domain-containing protein [Marinicella marina]MDJ1139751.1 methyltransferase domain-containing protein [Marinicella marina]
MPKNNQKHHEKYDSKNPIAQRMLQGFMDSITNLTQAIEGPITSLTECGCGQGHVNQHLEELFPTASIKGFDINQNDLNIAIANRKKPSTNLYLKSIYDAGAEEKADLVVCCEVLEHLEHPELALKIMASLNADYYLFSVPREPLWRILNFMRGKYMKDWGNTPDHCNHWSTRKFEAFVAQHLEVLKVNQPLPWSMILAKSK